MSCNSEETSGVLDCLGASYQDFRLHVGGYSHVAHLPLLECVHQKHVAEVGKFGQVNLKYVMFQKERCGALVKSLSYNKCVRLVED